MRPIALLIFLALATALLPARSQTLADFFLKIPDKDVALFERVAGAKLDTSARRRILGAAEAGRATSFGEGPVHDAVIDAKNGYLHFKVHPDGGEGADLTLTYWREKKGGLYLVGLTVDHWTLPWTVTETVRFYSWNGKELSDVTAQHLRDLRPALFAPKIQGAEELGLPPHCTWRWLLPRHGTTIRITCPELHLEDSAKALAKSAVESQLRWNGFDFDRAGPVRPTTSPNR